MRDESGYRALEPSEAGERDVNAAILATLALAAIPQPESVGPPWAVGGFGVRIHPDLVDRVTAIAAAADLEARFVYGVPVVRNRDGVIVAAAMGMREIRVRLRADQIAAALLASASADPDLGEGWACVSAWPADVPSVEIVPALAAVFRVAAQAVAPARARRRASSPESAPRAPRPARPPRTPRGDQP